MNSERESLKGRQRALHPKKARRLIQEACGDAWQIGRVRRIEIVKERIGRRLTARYEVEAGRKGDPLQVMRMYGKLYRGRRGERVSRVVRLLGELARDPIAFPELLGYHPRRRFLLLRAVSGQPLSEVLEGAMAKRAVDRFASSLAVLHDMNWRSRIPIGDSCVLLNLHDSAAEVEVLRQARDRVLASELQEDLRKQFDRTAQRACERLGAPLDGCARVSLSIIHRDLYPEQVVVREESMVFLDLDEVALGEAELDVGNFAAHLLIEDLQKRRRGGSGCALRAGFLLAYRDRRPFSTERLAAYEAASSLRLASLERLSHPERSQLSWPELATGLVERARQCLEAFV